MMALRLGGPVLGGSISSSDSPIPTPDRPTDLDFTINGTTGNDLLLSWTDNSSNESVLVIQYSVDGGLFKNLKTVPANTTTYQPTTLSAQASHYGFRVKAVNAGGSSQWSESIQIPPQLAPVLTGTPNFPRTRVTLQWSTEDQYTLFEVYRKPESGAYELIAHVDTNATIYQDDTVDAETVYSYKIRVGNAASPGEFSPDSNAVDVASQDVGGGEGGEAIGGEGGDVVGGEGGGAVGGDQLGDLLAPFNLQYVPDGANSYLVWEDSNTRPLDGFKIYRSLQGGVFEEFDTSVVTTFVVGDADDDWYVTAYESIDESTPSNKVYVVNYTPVSDLAGVRDSDTAATLTWTSFDYYDTVQIWRADITIDPDAGFEVVDYASGWVFTYEDTTLEAGKDYSYKIKHLKANNASNPSEFSNAATVEAGASGEELFTTAGADTFTAPAGVTEVTVECWGAGGGGGGGEPGGNAKGGGGGAYVITAVVAVTPENNHDVMVGAGGAGAPTSNTGGTGGDSYFIDSSTVMAKGGAGGLSFGPGGAGGSAASSIGDTKYSGGSGAAGSGGTGGGAGGSAGTGSAGNNGSGSTGGAAVAGGGAGGDQNTNGTVPGGGGGGGAHPSSGGSGVDGKVRISWG